MPINPSLESAHGDHIFAPIDLVGPGTAGEEYLLEFQALDPHAFAVIKVGGGIIDDPIMLERTGRAIAYLQEHDLYPVIVHGGGPQINRALEREGIESRFDPEDGNRITTPAAAFVIATTLTGVNRVLCGAIEHHGGMAQGITGGVFKASLLDEPRYGRVGRIEQIHDQPIHDAIDQKRIAVLSCGAQAAKHFAADSYNYLNLNGDVAAVGLTKKLEPNPHKFISLTTAGAVLDAKGDRIKALSPRQARRMKRKGVITGGMVLKVNEAMDLLEAGVDDVVFISPEALLLELFTDGAGTIMRNQRRNRLLARHLLPRRR